MMRAKCYLFVMLSLSAMGVLATKHPVEIVTTEGNGAYTVVDGVGWYFPAGAQSNGINCDKNRKKCTDAMKKDADADDTKTSDTKNDDRTN
ncbi:MAG: hypothetical protein GXP09_05680 [Gammaproteobacteria bacterium]|nr:hypothetical protein [Gammaproteobacteria bacterium]